MLRRRTGPNWTHGLQLEGEAHGDGGAPLLTLFSAGAHLAADGGRPEILKTAFCLAAPHRLEQTLVAHGGEYVVEPARLLLEDNLGTSLMVDPELIPIVLRLDGTQRVGAVIDDVVAASGIDRSGLSRRAGALLRSMLERGYLELPPGSA